MRKLSKVTTAIAFTATALIALPTASATASASTPASNESGPVQTLDAFSWGCKNAYPKRATFTYDGGVLSTTIHFNNQCSTKAQVTVWVEEALSKWSKCLSVNAGTKGKKKFGHSVSGKVVRLSKGC